MAPEFALAADMGPGIDASPIVAASPQREQKTLNSPLHDQEGQNVLFDDRHVEPSRSPTVTQTPANLDAFDVRG